MPNVQLRDDYAAAELRRLAKRSRNNRQIRRLLAPAAVYDGMSRADAAKVGGMDRRSAGTVSRSNLWRASNSMATGSSSTSILSPLPVNRCLDYRS